MRTVELRRQSQQLTTAVPVNNIEQKDLLNSLFTPISPKSMGYVQIDNNNSTPMPSPMPPMYNSTPPSYYSPGYQHQQNSPPVYRSPSLQYDPTQPSPGYHDLHTRVKTPVFDEFLVPSSACQSYIPVNNPSLSVHSYMNVSFQGTGNNPAPTIPPSSFNHQQHQHHNTTYPY